MKEVANDIYNQLVQNPSNDYLKVHYNLKTDQMHSFMRKFTIVNEQRMKLNWLVIGDRTTNFFYNRVNVLKPNRGSNYILNSNGTWKPASEKLAQEAISHFTNLFSALRL